MSQSTTPSAGESANLPATVLCIGMAGSGKTTFMQRLNSHLRSKKETPYVVNLDPAVMKVPFKPNIDIRDAVNYRKVIEEYNLGPNGAIMTSLNLFSTKIDQVINLIEARSQKSQIGKVIVDTPGQIECFIWSASGAIITDSFASTFPTVIAYIVDTPRTSNPSTFISNMLYACSILYKTKLPMIIVFNKTDVKDASFAKEWMTDFEAFQVALNEYQAEQEENGGLGSGYMGSLVSSLSLMLEEFYRHLDVVSVSAYTGSGFDEFLEAVDRKVDEYNEDYKAEREQAIKRKQEEEKKRKEKELVKLMKDLGVQDSKNSAKSEKKPVQADTISDTESIEDDEDPEAAGILERDEDEGFGYERAYEYPEEHDFDAEFNDNLSKADGSLQERYRKALEATSSEGEQKLTDSLRKEINKMN